ncbi:MAG: helix-turn-helix domain-containing protein [Sphingobium sp.]
MVRPALSANRALAVLDWVASHPKTHFTLSELSRGIGVNIPSLMAVLQSMTDAGYLSRDPGRKTYSVGPALFAIGLSVGAHSAAFGILGAELEQLAAAVGTECWATVAIGDKSMVVAEAGRPGSHSLSLRVGNRFPMIAPVGHAFVAWSESAQIAAWIDRAESDDFKLDRARIEQELALVRAQGYSVLFYERPGYRPSEALQYLTGEPENPERREKVRAAMQEFGDWEFLLPEPGRIYNISNVTAPVFDPYGKVLMLIVLNGFTQIEGGDLLGHVERLLQTTRILTKNGGGRMPAIKADRSHR